MSKELPEPGQRIKLIGTHPHTGNTGTVTAHTQLVIGWVARIDLDDQTTASTSLVFRKKDWEPNE